MDGNRHPSLFHIAIAAAPQPGWSRKIFSMDTTPNSGIGNLAAVVIDIHLDNPSAKYMAMLLVPGWDSHEAHHKVLSVVRERKFPILFVTWQGREQDAQHPKLEGLERIGCDSVPTGTNSIADEAVVTETVACAVRWNFIASMRGATKYFQWMKTQREPDTDTPCPKQDPDVHLLLQGIHETALVAQEKARAAGQPFQLEAKQTSLLRECIYAVASSPFA